MLSIRMRRMGSKKRTYYRVIVTEAKTPREGSFIEILGTYNPRTKPATVEIDRERVNHWIKRGARPSDSVRTLIARHLTKDRSAAAGSGPGIDAVTDLKALVETIARALADQPDAVRVGESTRRGVTVIELQVAPGDLGRVIGRQGRTAAAVRTLLSSAAEAEGKRATLDIRDSSGR